MIAVLMLVYSRDPEQDFVGEPRGDSEDIRDRLKAALQTLTGCSQSSGAVRGGAVFYNHFKLTVLHQGGDTDFVLRELWVRVNRKWSEELNQSHMTTPDDFLLLSPSSLICFFYI